MKNTIKIKKMIIYLSILSLLTSGCGKNKDNTYNYSDLHKPTYTNSDINQNSNYDNPITNIDDYNYDQNQITITDEAYNNFINYLNELETTYYYEEYYKIDETLAKYNEIKDISVTNHTHTLKELTSEELYKVVKENNKKYLEQKKKEYTASFYDELSDSELRNVCDIIIETIKYYQSDIADIEEVKCILGNLKILSKATLSNSSVGDDDCLLINLDMINTLKIKATSKDQDVVEDTVSHEAIHLLQKSCEDNLKVKYRIGNSYKFEDLPINSLFYNWFYEGSAEKLSNNYTGDTPLVYNYYINYINSLTLSTILNENNSVIDIEKTSLNKTHDSLFKIFDCNTESQKQEILKLMYSLEIIETDPEDFLKVLGLESNSDEYIKIKRNIKTSVCMTLTKTFYKNLSANINKGNVKLEDIFYLITVFESDIESHLTYTDSNKYEDSKEFIKEYIDLQNNFFALLSSSQIYTEEEIENIFNNYGITNSNGEKNYNLLFIAEEKRNFIVQILGNLKENTTEQIRDIELKNNKTMIKTK